jgi:transketolase
MALAAKMDDRDYRTYVFMGDGELAEGSVWEGAMSGANYHLDNLCALVDRNRLQISGDTEDVMKQDSQEERWAAFAGMCSRSPATTLSLSTLPLP